MQNSKSIAAVICILLMLSSPIQAQHAVIVNPPDDHSFVDKIRKFYMPREVNPISLANTNRLESLLRAGKLYLSLKDAIALGLENNLDIELQRYGPESAKASLLRAQAGGLLRGVTTAVQNGPNSATSASAGSQNGGAPAAANNPTTGSTGSSGSSGTTISSTGTNIPNLDPSFVSTFNGSHTTNPQSNTVTTGLSANVFDTFTHTYGYQQSFLSGTTASLSWNNQWLHTNNPLNAVNPFDSNNLQLQVTQRLLQGFGIAVNNRNIRIAKNNVRVSDLQFELQVITTVSSISNLYWDLVNYSQDLDVKRKAVGLAQKLYEDNKKQVEIGTLAPIEIVNAEAQLALAQQNLTVAETLLLQQETIVKNALSRNGIESPTVAEARVIATDRPQLAGKDPIQPLPEMYKIALQNRREVMQSDINIENQKITLKGSRSQLLPSLDVTASMQNNSLAGERNAALLRGQLVAAPADPYFIGGFGSTLGQLFRRNFPNYAAGFTLTVPIRNRSAQADMIIDTISLRQLELQKQRQLNQIRVDIQNAIIAVTQTRAQYQTAVKQRILQEQTLDAEQKKYALGASTVFFVIQYQRDLAQAQSNEVAALAAYAKARVQLDLATGLTLQTNNVDIDEAHTGKVSAPPSALPPEK